MKILLTGRAGQVGWELERSLRPIGEVFAADRESLDLGDPAALRTRVREVKPAVIVNAAAYTGVDRAESEPQQAEAINALAPGVLAEEAKRAGALLVHYSTDYVFDGSKESPYLEEDPPNPINTYGKTKLAGERAIQQSGCRHLILRTSWVYASRGKNFVLTILKAAEDRKELKVVNDQRGAPTWSRTIAQATSEALQKRVYEQEALLHLTSSGNASWHDFAAAILAETREWRSSQPALSPIPTRDYPTPARRPLNSRLSTRKLAALLGRPLPEWMQSLRECLSEIAPVTHTSARRP